MRRIPFCFRTGFTLIELLVTIAIIAVLIVLAFSVVSSIRGRARKIVCVNNLRNIGQSLLCYTNDHNSMLPGPLWVVLDDLDRYPEADGWNVPTKQKHLIYDLLPYGATWALATCPATQLYLSQTGTQGANYRRVTKVEMQDGSLVDPFGYPANGNIAATVPKTLVSLGAGAKVPVSQLALVYDYDKPIGAPAGYSKSPIHDNQRNYLFADGHVKTMMQSELNPLNYLKN